MMDPATVGWIMIALALAIMAVPPFYSTFIRPRIAAVHIAAILLEAHYLAPPRADLQSLIREADEALAKDPLISATALLAKTYDQA